jgi:assimilatory nitrate reductase catalytic subunit
LKEAVPEPVVEVSEKLAKRLDLKPDRKVRLVTRRGEALYAWKAKPEQEESTLFVPFHWGGEQSANLMTQEALDPVSRMPEFKVCAAQLSQDEKE